MMVAKLLQVQLTLILNFRPEKRNHEVPEQCANATTEIDGRCGHFFVNQLHSRGGCDRQITFVERERAG